MHKKTDPENGVLYNYIIMMYAGLHIPRQYLVHLGPSLEQIPDVSLLDIQSCVREIYGWLAGMGDMIVI